ncbi:hypothetical protein HPB51_020569 [Rhipicephalus microplus]|uniref:THAP-type domain-containing protein n=1 Tax=Rhipicephalus microplus TaxID=6941 RepID=A0A9J6DW45_RHIMP|nr:hypothetical protein HPB51_020569 [Rhipicephalus microplus]
MLHPRDGRFKGSRHRGSTLPAPATIEDVGAGGAAAPSGIEDLGAAREKVQKRITMGRCCMPNCKGNYDNGPKVHLFSFPSDPVRKAKWQRAVRRDDIDVCQLKNPQVCELHFKAEHLRTTSKYTDGDGRTIEVPMKLTRLMPDAVPTIFPGCPSYLSDSHTSREEPDVKRRRNENEQLLEAIQESALAFAAEQDENKVKNFEDITSRLTRLHQRSSGHKQSAKVASSSRTSDLQITPRISCRQCVCRQT